jgi:hypothetical protein
MLVLALAACDGTTAFDERDARIVGERMRTMAEFVFAESWCAGADVEDVLPGQLGCPAPSSLVVEDGVVSGVTARGVGVEGTLERGPERTSLTLDVILDDHGFDDLGRPVTVRWEGPLDMEAASPDFYEVLAMARGTATIDRPEGEDRVIHDRPFEVEVHWGTGEWPDECIAFKEQVLGRVGPMVVDWGQIQCISDPGS